MAPMSGEIHVIPAPVRAAALAALRAVGEGLPADRAVERALKAHPELDNPGRASLSDWVFQAALFRGRLDFLLGHEAGWEERLDALARDRAGEFAAVAWPADPALRLAAERSFPPWLARRLVRDLGPAEADAFCAASNERGPTTLRANAARTTRDALAARLRDEGVATERGTLAPHALRVLGRANLFGSPAWREGLFEVQDEGSQLVAAIAEAPGGEVLDLCAGAGGKTLALAASARVVHAHDPDRAKLRDLGVRVARAGLGNVHVVPPGEPLPGADAVLVDAPCSAVGALRRGPDARWRLSDEGCDRLPELQRTLLAQGAAQVRPGGRLVYATCTVLRAENEAVAESLDAPGFALEATRLLLPHRDGCDGFFIAAWRRE